MLDELRAGQNDVDKVASRETEFKGLGLAVASLVLGIISIPFAMFLIGGAFALIGLILAAVHIRKRYILHSMAWWGLGLSIAGLLAALIVGLYTVNQFRSFRETMTMMESQVFKEWIGKEAPNLTVTDLEGNSITLSQLRGRRVVLDFWATWCPPCRMETPHFVKMRNMYDSNDVAIIAVSSEDGETIRSFAKKQKINYTLALEGDLSRPYADVTSLPTTFFIDRDGLIQYVAEGYHDFEDLNAFVIDLDRKDPNQPPEPQQ